MYNKKENVTLDKRVLPFTLNHSMELIVYVPLFDNLPFFTNIFIDL